MRTNVSHRPPLFYTFVFMKDFYKHGLFGAGLGLATDGINALYGTATQERQMELQKKWWYEQQKYLEEHNSPAYQSMLLRKAGLNPYDGLGSQPLGNVSSDLPSRPMELFNSGAISGLMQTLSQLEVNEAHANQLEAQAGLFGAQTKTEDQRYQQLVQAWFYNEIMYEIGLITLEERGIKRDELKEAYKNGTFTPTTDAHNLSVSQSEYYSSLSSFYDKSVEKMSEEISSLKRANKIGDEYDGIIAQYKLAVAQYEANIKDYESKMSQIAQHALKEFGWDLKTIPPVYHPFIIPLVNADINGSLSANDFNSAIDTMSNWSGHQINYYNKSTNPDYIDAPTNRKLNIAAAEVDGSNIFKAWTMQMDEARFDLDVINTIRNLFRILPRSKTTNVVHTSEK